MNRIIVAAIVLLSMSGAALSEDAKCNAMIQIDALLTAAQKECGFMRIESGLAIADLGAQCAGKLNAEQAQAQREIGETKFTSQFGKLPKDEVCAGMLKTYSRNLAK